MVGLHLAVLIIFSEAAPANGVDTAFYFYTVVSLAYLVLLPAHKVVSYLLKAQKQT